MEKVPKNELTSKSSGSEVRETKHESSRKSGDKRIVESSGPKFLNFSADFVNLIAESMGISDISGTALSGLGEDVSYKVREMIHHCNNLLKNTKRRKLTSEDVTRTFQIFNVPSIYGYGSCDESGNEFINVPEADVYVVNDVEQDVVQMATTDLDFPQFKDNQYIKGAWAVTESSEQLTEIKQRESVVSVKPGPSTDKSSPNPKPTQKPPGKQDDTPGAARPPTYLLNYYLQIAKIILSGATSHLQFALADLKTNPNVGPVCPFFLNLVALSVNKLNRHYWLTDALLSTVKALVENQYVDPSCYLAVNRATNSLLVIAIETKVATNGDDLLLRSRAAELLSKVLLTWNIEMKQQMDSVKQLLQLLIDKNLSLQAQYGAIVCLISLGYRILYIYFWPVMEHSYFAILDEKQKTCSAVDIAHVKGAIMMAAELMYRKDWNSCSAEESKRRLKVDYLLYDYFGDSFVPRRQQYLKQRVIYPKVKPIVNVDYDFDHENWNPSYMMQRKPLMQSSNPYINRNVTEVTSALTIYSVFDLTHRTRSRNISFNFEGSNQIDNSKLKRKILDQKQICQNTIHKLSNLWYKQNIYKNTRTIKYCGKVHTKCSSGDLLIPL